jgi:hypothetical protein
LAFFVSPSSSSRPSARRFGVAAAALVSLGLAACGGGGGGGSTPATPQATPLAFSGTATDADAFVNSIGVNTHLGVDTPYTSAQFPQLNALLTQLGVRHVRDSAYDASGESALCAEEQTLASAGIHFDYITAPALPTTSLAGWAACVGPALEDFEGPNEYDIYHPVGDTAWPQQVQAYQAALYAAVKGNPATATVPVFGPTFTALSAYQSVGNLTGSLDDANIHPSFDGFSPGNTGYGANGYGSLAYSLAFAAIEAPHAPVVVTESVYSTIAATNGVSPDVQAKYTNRELFDFYDAGVARSYVYEFADELPANFDDDAGIVTNGLAPKPAYAQLASLIALLTDPGTAYTPGPIGFSVANATPDMRFTPLEKRDGSFYIAFWRETPSWNPNTQATIAVPTVTVTVTLPTAPSSATVYTFNASNALQAAPVAAAPSFTLQVTDNVSVLHLVPVTGTTL